MEFFYYLVSQLIIIDNKVWKPQEKVYQNLVAASTLNSNGKCGHCASAKKLSKWFSFSRHCRFTITKVFHDLIVDLHMHHGVIQVKINNTTKFHLVFFLRILRVGCLFNLEHKEKSIKNDMFSFCQLCDVVHKISTQISESCLFNSILFTESNNQIDENFRRGKMAGSWIRNLFCSNIITHAAATLSVWT